MQAVILAGGLGTRLRGVLDPALPKPMAPVGDRPFLELMLDELIAGGVDEVLLLVGHRAAAVSDHFGSTYRGVPLAYAVETTPLGTGGAVAGAREALAERFLLLNGDTYLGVGYAALLDCLDSTDLAMSLVEVPDVGRFGSVDVAGDRVIRFAEKGRSGPGLINGGVYAVRRDQLEAMPVDRAFSFEADYLEPRLGELRPRFVVADGPFFDIGVPDDYAAATDYLLGR